MVQCGSKYPARATHQDVSHFLVRGILVPPVSGQQLEPANIFAGICRLPQGTCLGSDQEQSLSNPQVMINRKRVQALGSQSAKGQTGTMHGIH